MNSKQLKRFSFFALMVMLLQACNIAPAPVTASVVETAEVSPAAVEAVNPSTGAGESMELLTGDFSYSNDFVVEVYMVEQAVALTDMTGFIKRDKEWELPVDSQVLGYVNVDKEKNQGTYRLQLPVRPAGILNDVDQDGEKDNGVQVFAVGYSPNLAGGPFSEGDDPSYGWPNYLASVKTDSENQDEVTGGKLVIWAPDDQQQFPTDFGADGLLFTMDDPVGPVAAGYSVIDLDSTPFNFSRAVRESIKLYEPTDVALKDFSALSYTQAFEKMFEIVRAEYAFNGIEGKQPDWDVLYDVIKPEVQAAETNKDARAYFEALQEFTLAFKDGHVNLDGGQIAQQVLGAMTGGGYGFAIRELDDGSVLVTYVLAGGPADALGMKVGARVTEFNGMPIAQAISLVSPFTPQSSDFALRYQQERYLLAVPPGTAAKVTFANPGQEAKTVSLTAIPERFSFSSTSLFRNYDPNALPVESRILDSGAGYVRVNSNYDDLNLVIRLFQRALETFQKNQVTGIIIDMRLNSGGAPLGLAGFLTDQIIPLGQLQYYSEKTGKFEPDGVPEKVRPMQEQYRFNKMALLVDQSCFSACEIESYGFSQVPGMVVVGQYPTGGVEAEVARGQFAMPEGFTLQIPTGRFVLPDGSIFLEGKGVQPTVRVPINEANVLSSGKDVVLNRAESIVLVPEGADIEPEGAPQMGDSAASQQAMQKNTPFLETLARERYDGPPAVGESNRYTVLMPVQTPVMWMNGWCAKDQATLEGNLKRIEMRFNLDGQDVPLEKFTRYDGLIGSQTCQMYYSVLDQWPAGKHSLQVQMDFSEAVDDGQNQYPAGTRTYDYSVYVSP